jgi:integrase
MLKLPNKNRLPGMFLYCNVCKKHYSNDSSLNKKGKCKGKCIANNTVVYKAKLHIPGTKFGVRCKTLMANNFEDAQTEFIEFKSKISANDFQKIIIQENEIKPTLLIDCMAYYIAFLRNEGVPRYDVKIRTEKHINEVERYFKYVITCLSKNKIDVKIFQFENIDKRIVGIITEYIEDEKLFKNKTYNKFIGIMKLFHGYISKEYNYAISNPFDVRLKKLSEPVIETITKKEFEELLNKIKPENGITYLPRTKEKKNLYKDWLISAFKLGLLTGRRREEIVMLKFSDIKLDENDELSYIQSKHLKINRAFNHNKESETNVKISITKQLKVLLFELGYEKYKGQEKYILAPEETMKRITMMDLISKAFTHFYNQIGSSKKLVFKNLRKTYVSSAYKHFGEKARILTKHASVEIMQKHYIDREILNEANSDFDVFE